MVGHVTSSYFSPNLDRSFALALIKGGLEKKGKKTLCPNGEFETIEVEITDPVFIDPENVRINK